MIGFSARSFRLWQRNGDVFLRVWWTELPGMVAEPLFVLLAMGFGLGGFVGNINGQRYIEFIAPGIIAAYAMFSPVFECTYGSFVRMRYQRTYDAIITTPLDVNDVIAGEMFWGATRAVMTSVMILAVLFVFRLVASPWALLVPFLAVLEGLMFASIAMFYTSLARSIYTFNYFFTIVITPMFYFSGVFFPISSFPAIVQKLSWIAPLTPITKLARGLVSGRLESGLWFSVALVVVITVLFFSLAMVTMRRRLIV
jgi:lipooligosaccharide transport system permease protein